MADLPKVNFEVTETWTMACPYCDHEGEAPLHMPCAVLKILNFNERSPMSPMEVECAGCGGRFILTYDRDDT